ncbi:Aste57867_21485 [Aphanomyces stellatus]|uniref:Aste57867_21485 protein n=1 Tax=Aphanomyces stellatus TaxID=120398 RepID=A0A485LJ14_9STRA|nr:hypothetical protein As57867_021416 [Aphanomyces stellatus]VFT98155.1 Aste57867_21485 [Aphanomyces stellatus]
MTGRRRRFHDSRSVPRRLPPELIQRIAIYIPNTDSFFTYLEAFQDTNALGRLRHLWHLAQVSDRADLWPDLHVYALTEDIAVAVRALGQVFETIHFHETFDVVLLQQCVSPSTSFALHVDLANHAAVMDSPSFPLVEWYAQLTRLPIVDLIWEKQCDPGHLHVHALLNVLPSFHRLQSLDLGFAAPPFLEPILRFVATSSLTDLNLRIYDAISDPRLGHLALTTTDILLLTQWVVAQPVRTFSVVGCTAAHVSPAAMAPLHAALWTKSSLCALGLQVSALSGLAAYPFAAPLRLSDLALQGCDLGPLDIKMLCRGLQHSDVTLLDLTCNPLGVAGVDALAAVLPDTALVSLKLVLTQAGDEGCCALATALPSSRVEELHLGMNLITSVGAADLANAVRAAASITTLRLQKNRITAAGAAALVQAMGAGDVERTLLDLRKNSLDEADQAMLGEMAAALPQLRGCALTKRVK